MVLVNKFVPAQLRRQQRYLVEFGGKTNKFEKTIVLRIQVCFLHCCVGCQTRAICVCRTRELCFFVACFEGGKSIGLLFFLLLQGLLGLVDWVKGVVVELVM
jgi:hypothetical protein